MMAYVQDGVVLMPNQILPFYEDRRACVAMLRTAVEQQKTIAILHLRYVCESFISNKWRSRIDICTRREKGERD